MRVQKARLHYPGSPALGSVPHDAQVSSHPPPRNQGKGLGGSLLENVTDRLTSLWIFLGHWNTSFNKPPWEEGSRNRYGFTQGLVQFPKEKWCFLLTVKLMAILSSYWSSQTSSELSENHLKSCPGTKTIFTFLFNLRPECSLFYKWDSLTTPNTWNFKVWSVSLHFSRKYIWGISRDPIAGADGGDSHVIVEKNTGASQARQGTLSGCLQRTFYLLPLNISRAETSSTSFGLRPSSMLAIDFLNNSVLSVKSTHQIAGRTLLPH